MKDRQSRMPRLYVDAELSPQATLELPEAAAHRYIVAPSTHGANSSSP